MSFPARASRPESLVRGDVISHTEMCAVEGMNLQAGMNFGNERRRSVILMSLRPGAPYADRIEDEGRTLIYEGHDVPRTKGGPDPKTVDQVGHRPSGSLTENGKFAAAAEAHNAGSDPELVQVYEKIQAGIWVYNGAFRLVDSWMEPSGSRRVFKFRLELFDGTASTRQRGDLTHERLIPSAVKREVWKRDRGRCVECGASDNLHFDHIIPFSRGGSSLLAENIQLLCARHNLAKSAHIR